MTLHRRLKHLQAAGMDPVPILANRPQPERIARASGLDRVKPKRGQRDNQKYPAK